MSESAPHGRVLLVALTPETRTALGGSLTEIERFPYRVGRESRATQRTPGGFVTERRSRGSRPTNDLYLVEHDEPMNVSRSHFQIDWADASYVLVDLESTCGTIVEGTLVGQQRHAQTEHRPVALQRQLAVHVEVAGEPSGDEVLGAVLDPLDWAAQQ